MPSKPKRKETAAINESPAPNDPTKKALALPMKKPLVFLSHKHADEPIASKFSDFISKAAAGRVEVYQSSNYRHRGPEPGAAGLSDQLRNAIAGADVFVLIYTFADHDWANPIFETGIALDPGGDPTTVFVVQCTQSEPPRVLADSQVYVDARELKDVTRFVVRLLTGTTVFHSFERKPLSGWAAESKEVEEIAQAFYAELKAILPESPPLEATFPVPMLAIELLATEAERLVGGATPDDIANARIALDQRAGDEIFGVTPATNLTLRELKERAQANADFFAPLYEQILAALKLQVLAPVLAINNRHGSPVVPAAVRCRRSASTATVEVDISFVPLDANPKPA